MRPIPAAFTIALALASALPAAAGSLTERGEFVFDISSREDMREVGQRAGIRISGYSPMDIGRIDCGRWAHQFNVFPYEPVVAGTLSGRPGLVWICSGQADSAVLSTAYCEEMGMSYVKHEGSVVTCRVPNQA